MGYLSKSSADVRLIEEHLFEKGAKGDVFAEFLKLREEPIPDRICEDIPALLPVQIRIYETGLVRIVDEKLNKELREFSERFYINFRQRQDGLWLATVHAENILAYRYMLVTDENVSLMR